MTLSKFRITDTLAALQVFCNKLHDQLPYIYLMYAIPAIALATWITPPFQVPDEPHHFFRAEQISRGELAPVFYTDGSKEPRTTPDERVLMPDIGGFSVNSGAVQLVLPYLKLGRKHKAQLRKAQLDASKEISWDAEIGYVNFSNTAIYPPTGYLFATIGIILGKLTNASIMDSFYLARSLNGIFCVLICFYALRMSKAGRLLLFTALLFPMINFLFASVSQDGVLISLAFLLFAIIGHVESSEEKHYPINRLVIMVIAIVALSAARPPYFMFSFIFFFLNIGKQNKLICFFATLVPVVLWGLLNLRNYAVIWAPASLRINAPLQIKHILADPMGFIGLFFQFNFTYIREVACQFIGVLGWLDLPLPGTFYRGAFFSLLFAAAISVYKLRERMRLRSVLIALAIAAGIAVIIVQYINWMPLEAPSLGGLQGRYFIPLFPAIAIALAGFHKNRPIKKWHTPLLLGIIVFPVISTVVMVWGLMEWYYLGD